MTYLNSHDRTNSPTKGENFQAIGRTPALFGVFVGYVKDTKDVQKNGRLRVWIPEFGSSPENEEGWIIVSYCSPFAGATNIETSSKTNFESFNGTQTSYGMWMIPPDINNSVLVMFINGDPGRGIWIGSLFNQFMNDTVPTAPYSSSSYQYKGKNVPIAEYNKWDEKVTKPDGITKPFHETKFKGVGNQGLIKDKQRGITTTSARREAPSNVYGILTPGPVIDETASPENIRRKGGSSFILDDGKNSEYIQLATKTSAQIKIDESNEFIYLINRDGTAWVQMDSKGNIDIFGARDISMRAQRDFNIRADRNINFEAGQNIFMKAAKDTLEGASTFTYDVNNIPKTENVKVWNFVGEGKGTGGNIVMQALNNWHSTTKSNAFLTVTDNNFDIKIGNAFSLTTVNGTQDYSSKQGIKITTDAALDISTTGNIRVGSKGIISVVGIGGIVACTDSNISLKAQDSIKIATVNTVSISSDDFDVTSDSKFSQLTAAGTANLLAQYASVASSLGSVSTFLPPPEYNPDYAEGALSARQARPAEVKPLNEKINILATWSDPQSKFNRNNETIFTTVSRFPTFEPCPEHENFNLSVLGNVKTTPTEAEKTYKGSGGAGNEITSQPEANTTPGANNTSVQGDSAESNFLSKDINIRALECQLKIHESVVLKSYQDTTGLAAGVGHLLRADEVIKYPLGTPVSQEQVDIWLSQDIQISLAIAQRLCTVWGELSDIRKRALTDLAFNLGEPRLSKFKKFLAAMNNQDFENAGKELRNSIWFTQVGRRGPNIITMIVQNVDPNNCDRRFPN